MKKYLFLLIIFLLAAQQVQAAPDKNTVNTAITKAQKYYEGLYVDLGSKGAVVKEYYSSPKSTYTIRHGVAGGVFYYTYTGDTTKAAKLEQFAEDNGYSVNDDLHSYIWTESKDRTPEDLYSDKPYQDCNTQLPKESNNLVPYHSKVCKLGVVGLAAYKEITKHDTLVPAIQQLQNIETGKEADKAFLKDLENKFDKTGNGIPMCFMNMCQDQASAIRTATFGELELRTGNTAYADKAAEALLKAQDKNGAIYLSFDKDGKLKNDQSWIYQLINKILSDNPVFHGYIPTNAESLNDILAFLFHWRCVRFGICK